MGAFCLGFRPLGPSWQRIIIVFEQAAKQNKGKPKPHPWSHRRLRWPQRGPILRFGHKVQKEETEIINMVEEKG